MNYREWQDSMPKEITEDALWKMEVYRQALFLSELGWIDATKLQTVKTTVRLSSQLYGAVGGISANIAEGYSRKSGKDQARYYEYALGSARESKSWYIQSHHVLGDDVVNHRLGLLTHVIKQLIVIIPTQRGHRISEESPIYETNPFDEGHPIP